MNAEHTNILYVGSTSSGSTSMHRADAFRRIGCQVHAFDPQELIGSRNRIQSALDYRTGYAFCQKILLHQLMLVTSNLPFSPDLIWVNSGEYIGPAIMKWFTRRFGCKIVLYQNDDPTGSRDGNRFLNLRASLHLYDLCVLVRPETALEALALGARKVLRVFMSYDEVQHEKVKLIEHSSLRKSISFIGTFIPGECRDKFLLSLANARLPLRIVGDRWRRSHLFSSLNRFYHGTGLKGSSYSEALSEFCYSEAFSSK